jgi:hypothetical protein
MNCPKCGVELLQHVSFCPLCGSELPDDLWKKRTPRPAKPKAKRPVRTSKPKTVTMRPTEQAPEEPKKVTMRPIDTPPEEPKKAMMRRTEPVSEEPEMAGQPAEGSPGKPPTETPKPPTPPEGKAAVHEPEQKEGPAEEPAKAGDTVDMLCPMCDTIVSIPTERPIHVKCPKCGEEYYFTN